MLRMDTPIIAGRVALTALVTARTGSFSKQRSRNWTSCPASVSADATHASPFGTTGYGWRSRLALTRSTRELLCAVAITRGSNRSGPTRKKAKKSQKCAERRADGIHCVVIEPGQSARGSCCRTANVNWSFRCTVALIAPPFRLKRCAEQRIDRAAADTSGDRSNKPAHAPSESDRNNPHRDRARHPGESSLNSSPAGLSRRYGPPRDD